MIIPLLLVSSVYPYVLHVHHKVLFVRSIDNCRKATCDIICIKKELIPQNIFNIAESASFFLSIHYVCICSVVYLLVKENYIIYKWISELDEIIISLHKSAQRIKIFIFLNIRGRLTFL